uniref:NADH dehydrogenase subunit 5 n=1 Tax=Laudakia tuberculata TaxID=118215 RepID=UPI0030E0950D
MMKQMMITLFLTTILLLTLPLVSKKYKITTTVKISFFISIMPTMLMMKHQMQNMSMTTNLMDTSTMSIMLTTTMNKYSMLFLPTALLVTWSILEFSTWYMTMNSLTKKFKKYLLIFLVSMVILATAGSFMQLLIGWEGVGIMSFMLINWWSTRMNANSAALQAIIYNRIGDIGLILAMLTLMSDLGTWNTETAITLHTKNTLITLGLVMAAMGKSAQFFMHMWLPAAMEGPTPVSSLLHSSTMVVAGVYMLAQMHPMMNTTYTTTICLFLGATTSMYSATCAIVQNDIKKIIAFSTSSQLGLMMLAIGMNKPNLAIFHMITHATFKSTLFLTAGSIIHNMQNEQDIRKTNCTKTTMPMTMTIMTINGLTLAGVPFLSGFYSKDAIIETMLTSNCNAWIMMSTLIATTMTSAYTLRMIIYTAKKIFNHRPMLTQQEATNTQMMPLIRLTMATIMTGMLLSMTMTNSPILLNKTMKMLTTMTILIGSYLTTELTTKPMWNTKNMNWKFISQLAFFKSLHRTLPMKMLKFSQNKSTQLTDSIWLESIGPKMLDLINTTISKIVSMQKGQMKTYLSILLITMITALISQTI